MEINKIKDRKIRFLLHPFIKFYFVLFFMIFSFLFDANAKKNKPLVLPNKKGALKRTVSQEVNYNCQFEYKFPGSTKKNKFILADEYTFFGNDSKEVYKLNLTPDGPTLQHTSFFEEPRRPYISDLVTCDANLNCRAARTQFSGNSSKRKHLEIRPVGAQTEVLAEEKVIFRYSRLLTGFQFVVPIIENPNAREEILIQCEQ